MEITIFIEQLIEKYSAQYLNGYKEANQHNPHKINRLKRKEEERTREIKSTLLSYYSEYKSKFPLIKTAILDEIQYKLDCFSSYIKKAETDLLRQDFHKDNHIVIVVGLLTEEQCLLDLFECYACKEFWETVRDKFLNPKSSSPAPTKKQTPTLLILFKNNEERLERFFNLLRRPEVGALNEQNEWIFNDRKTCIVACFQSLQFLDIFKKHYKQAKVRRIVETKISFEGAERLFRSNYNQDDYDEFYKLFKNHLS